MILDDIEKKMKNVVENTINNLTGDAPLTAEAEQQRVQEWMNDMESSRPFRQIKNNATDFTKNIFKGSDAFNDGYQFGDVSQSIVDTTYNIGNSIMKGATGVMQGFADLGVETLGRTGKAGSDALYALTKQKGFKKLSKVIEQELKNYEQDSSQYSPLQGVLEDNEKKIKGNSILGTSADSILQSTGSSIAFAGMNPLGDLPVGKIKAPVGVLLSSTGSSVKENYAKGADGVTAWLNGAGKGLISGISEGLFEVLGTGGSNIDDAIREGLTKNLNNQITRALVNLGIDGMGEASEEFIEYFGDYVLNHATDFINEAKGKDDVQLGEEWDSNEVIESMMSAFLSTGLSSATTTASMLSNKRDVVSGLTYEQQKQVDEVLNDKVKEKENKTGKRVNNFERATMRNEVTDEVLNPEQATRNKVIKQIEESKSLSNEEKNNVLAMTNNMNEEMLIALARDLKTQEDEFNKPAEVKEAEKAEIEKQQAEKDAQVKATKQEVLNAISRRTDMSQEEKQLFSDALVQSNNEELINAFKEEFTANNKITQENVENQNIVPSEASQEAKKEETILPSKNQIAKQYASVKIDEDVVKNATEIVPANSRGTRTKSEWLKVAEQIGMSIDTTDLEKYAYKTWAELNPNVKSNLNREGKGYVNFTLEDWTNAVRQGNNAITQNSTVNTTNSVEKKIAPVSNAQNNTKVERNTTTKLNVPVGTEMTNTNERYSQKDVNTTEYFNSAREYNIDTNNKSVQLINDIATDRGLQVTYDAKEFNDANTWGKYATYTDSEGNVERKIVLNPLSNTTDAERRITAEKIFMHELTHDLENTKNYKQFAQTIIDTLSQDSTFKELMVDLAYNYKSQSNISNDAQFDAYVNSDRFIESIKDFNTKDEFAELIRSEAIADYIGENLGNREFINRLATNTNESTFKKIVNNIKDFIEKIKNKITNKEYLNKWIDIKNQYEQAYNDKTIINEIKTKYNMKTDVNGNQYFEIKNDILKNVNKENWLKVVKELFKEKYSNGIDMGFFTIGFNSRSKNEYLYSEYTKKIKKYRKNLYEVKLRLVDNLDKIIQNANNTKTEIAKHDYYKSYNRGYINVKIGNKFYNMEVVTGINSLNKEMFYDIVNIKEGLLPSSLSTKISNNPSTNSISQKSNYVNNNQEKISKALYVLNKEAKKLRDVNTDIYDHYKYGEYEYSDNTIKMIENALGESYENLTEISDYVVGETHTVDNIDDEVEAQEKETDYAERILDDKKEELENDEIDEEDYEEAENDYKYEKEYLENLQEIQEKLHTNDEKIRNLIDEFKTKKSELYKLKENVIKKLNLKPEGYHVMSDGNMYVYYKYGDFSFHVPIEETNYNEANLKNLGEIKDLITSESNDVGITEDEAIKILNDYLSSSNNIAPTNEDIRYSQREQTSTKNLIAQHNTTEEKLREALELGGLPVPSIAITKHDIPMTQFGGITFLFNKDTIDPSNYKNEVYDRDAYTNVKPQVDYVLNDKNIKNVAKDLDVEWWRLNDYAEDSSSPADLVNKLLNYSETGEKLVDDYIKNNNLKYETKYKEVHWYDPMHNTDEFKKFVANNDLTIEKLANDKELRNKYYEITKINMDKDTQKWIDDSFEVLKDKGIQDFKEHPFSPAYRGIGHINYDLNNILEDRKAEVDNWATNKEKMQIAKDNGIEDYLKEKVKNIFGEKGIYKEGVDPFRSDGTRKGFWQTHDKYNLSNIVREMTKGKTTGTQSFFSVTNGGISSRLAKQFNSIEDIKAYEDKIDSNANSINEEVYKKLEDAVSDLSNYSNSDFNAYGNAREALADMADNFSKSAEDLQSMLKKYYGMNVPIAKVENYKSILNELKNAVTDYFEAKPQRAVGFEEVKKAIVPKGTSQDIVDKLKSYGIEIEEYDQTKEGAQGETIDKASEDIRFSRKTNIWSNYLKRTSVNEGTGSTMSELTSNPLESNTTDYESGALAPVDKNKVMNPYQIANMTKEDVSSTPEIELAPAKNKGDKKSKFADNVGNKSKFLNEDLRNEIKNDADVQLYESITNKDTLNKAKARLDDGGISEVANFFSDKKSYSADDIAEGWILLKRYQDAGDYNSAIAVARKMRDIGTKAGQTIQAFAIMNRLTPQGMQMFAQSELDELFDKVSKTKTQKWINSHKGDFMLTSEETEFIMEQIKKAQGLEMGSYEQKVVLGEIQKMLNDKIDSATHKKIGEQVKAWMRISMLLNPKTQVRNVAGNAMIAPVNMLSDLVASKIDKAIAKKTGTRTIGTTNVKALIKGFKEGAYQATNDYKMGINTRDINGNRFEVGQGKSFNEKTFIGKSLNRTEAFLNYIMDAGDRVFSQSAFEQSLQNQMILNNTEDVTQEMIDIAQQEALSRTWNDNNEYTKFVLNIRKGLNNLSINGYGLGDVLIPFAKTPANLTKALVDYSPVGLVNTLKQGIQLQKDIGKGTNTAMQQHQFADTLGKAMAGSVLYVLGYALAKMGITTGDDDPDKDVANFEKNVLGKTSYSIKIGNKSYKYDWAQPIGTPLAVMADIVNMDKDTDLLTKIKTMVQVPVNQIVEQSFLQTIQSVLSNKDGIPAGIVEAIEDLPARAIPTFVKEIADMVDSTQRQTYVKGNGTKTAINKVVAKIPFASKTLAPVVDTLGREQQKYGGKNNLFNVFLNPANLNQGVSTKSAEEIYRVYKQTGDKTILPYVAGYSVKISGNEYTLSPKEKAQYQKVMGQYVNKNVEKLIDSKEYQKLTEEEQAKIIKDIVSDSAELAREDYSNTNNLNYTRPAKDYVTDEEIEKGLDLANAYIYKTKISKIGGTKNDKGTTITNSAIANKIDYIMNMDISKEQKQHLINLVADGTDIDELSKYNYNYIDYKKAKDKQKNKNKK